MTETQGVLASTIAVNATTTNTLVKITDRQTERIDDAHDSITALRAGLRLIAWGVPLLIAAIGVGIPLAMFLSRVRLTP